jgi:hypothetical protein
LTAAATMQIAANGGKAVQERAVSLARVGLCGDAFGRAGRRFPTRSVQNGAIRYNTRQIE